MSSPPSGIHRREDKVVAKGRACTSIKTWTVQTRFKYASPHGTLHAHILAPVLAQALTMHVAFGSDLLGHAAVWNVAVATKLKGRAGSPARSRSLEQPPKSSLVQLSSELGYH